MTEDDVVKAARWKALADQGNAWGQNNYGNCLKNGLGVGKNLSEAAKYYKLSADQGNASGQINYGHCLDNGLGVGKNLSEAAKYYKLSADQGDALGQNNYGVCLKNGWGVSKDLNEAAKYLKLSADQGNASGQINYGHCLENGLGVPKDLRAATDYYRKAMEQGCETARDAYNRCMACLKSDSSGDHQPTPELLINLNNYQRVKTLGRGKFGIVRLVENKSNGERLAVKYIEGGPEFDCDRLFREVGILSSLNHPCIIRFVGWSLPNSECEEARIALEFASNGSIEDVLSRIKKGDTPAFWTHENISCMIIGLVVGMQYLHSHNIIHRDLKPANLLIDEKYRLRICDFGTAVFEECGTTTGMGTLCYMAPESLEAAPPTKKVDVFAFGLILYELLVGESVFPKDVNPIRLAKLLTDNIRPEIPKSVAPVISRLIEKCWTTDPNSRPTFDEIYSELEGSWFPFFDNVPPKVLRDYLSEVGNRH
jgi:tRNA A-37 threonylcarbamoyl transferase component Bud32